MKTKIFLSVLCCCLSVALIGLLMSRHVQAQVSVPSGSLAEKYDPLEEFTPDDDWNYWSNPPNIYTVQSGNVGIGTNNPQYMLHVEGKAISGVNSEASGEYATVSGGVGNSASWFYTTVGGGAVNTASGGGATVGGGLENTADNSFATVSGGAFNTAYHVAATVPGGFLNVASGIYSFAAGRQARAHHSGTFVWADNTSADFVSTAPNQFLILANGGVGINTNSPENALHVNGAINLNPITAPATPTTGFVIYCDSADGELKAKASTGTVTVLASD